MGTVGSDPFTAAFALCDPDGVVRRGAMHHGTDYPCTGSAHYEGAHIRCTSLAHQPTRKGAIVQKPTVGRIVHYVSYGTPGGEYTSQCRAAVVTEVGCWVTVREQYVAAHDATEQHRARDIRQWFIEDACALAVLNPTGEFFNECQHDEDGKAGGTWHWPERDEPGPTAPPS